MLRRLPVVLAITPFGPGSGGGAGRGGEHGSSGAPITRRTKASGKALSPGDSKPATLR